jgi:hypothetical protein
MSTRIDPNALKNAWTEWLAGLGNLGHGPAGQVYKEWETWFSAQFEKLAKNDAFLGQVAKSKEWESWFSTQFEKLANNETFLGTMAKSMENNFLLKSQFDRMMETSARALHMPTSGDVEQIHKRLDELERRLDAVLSRLETQAPRSAESAGEGEAKAARGVRRPAPKATQSEG